MSNLNCSKGSLTYEEFADFYYKAVGDKLYTGMKIILGLGGSVQGRVLEPKQEHIRFWTIDGKERLISYGDITEIKTMTEFQPSIIISDFMLNGYGGFNCNQFPVNDTGYNVKRLVDGINVIVSLIEDDGKAWRGEASIAGGGITSFRSCSAQGTHNLLLDGSPVHVDTIQSIGFQVEYVTPIEGAITGGSETISSMGFDSAMKQMNMEKKPEGKDMTGSIASFYNWMSSTFKENDLVSITMRNGKGVTGNITEYVECGNHIMAIVKESSSYGHAAAFNTHAIKLDEISEISYNTRSSKEPYNSFYN